MATTAPKRSTYRERRIHAMLQDGAADTPPPSEKIAPTRGVLPEQSARPEIRPERQPLRPSSSASRQGRLGVVLAGVATALLCAIAVFYIFFRRDHSAVPQARTPQQQHPAAASTPAPVRSAPAPPAVATSAEVSKQPLPALEPVQFSLKRSKLFEKIGPVRLRLTKANLKWRTCDLYIAAGGPTYQKQAHLNKPFQIDLPDNNGPVQLIVTNIGADRISGLIQSAQ